MALTAMVQYGSSLRSETEAREIPEMAASSRRRHRRIDALGRCFAQLGGGWEASVVNLSMGGMFIRLKRALTPGSTYFVKLLFDDEVAIVEARVLRLAESTDECFAAFQFTSVSMVDATCLRGFLKGRE